MGIPVDKQIVEGYPLSPQAPQQPQLPATFVSPGPPAARPAADRKPHDHYFNDAWLKSKAVIKHIIKTVQDGNQSLFSRDFLYRLKLHIEMDDEQKVIDGFKQIEHSPFEERDTFVSRANEIKELETSFKMTGQTDWKTSLKSMEDVYMNDKPLIDLQDDDQLSPGLLADFIVLRLLLFLCIAKANDMKSYIGLGRDRIKEFKKSFLSRQNQLRLLLRKFKIPRSYNDTSIFKECCGDEFWESLELDAERDYRAERSMHAARSTQKDAYRSAQKDAYERSAQRDAYERSKRMVAKLRHRDDDTSESDSESNSD